MGEIFTSDYLDWLRMTSDYLGEMADSGGARAVRPRPCQAVPPYQGPGQLSAASFFPPARVHFGRTAVPDQCLQGFGAFRAVPGWSLRYGPGREFRPMFMRSGTAVRLPEGAGFRSVVTGQSSVVSRHWSVVSGQSSVVSRQWSVVSGQWSVVSGQ